jgi:hypothetical protein
MTLEDHQRNLRWLYFKLDVNAVGSIFSMLVVIDKFIHGMILPMATWMVVSIFLLVRTKQIITYLLAYTLELQKAIRENKIK